MGWKLSEVFSRSSAQSSFPTFKAPEAFFSDRGGALECIFGDNVASKPWTTEWMVSFTSEEVGSDNSATYSNESNINEM